MASKKQMETRAAELDCTVEADAGEVTITAPVGYTLDGGHYFTNVKSDGENCMADVYDDCLDNMAGGLEPCTDTDCDICNND